MKLDKIAGMVFFKANRGLGKTGESLMANFRGAAAILKVSFAAQGLWS